MTLTLAALVREASARLARAGVPSPEYDAMALLALTLGIDRSGLRTAMARGDDVPAHFDPHAFEDAVARRESREPLQHITGRAGFRTLELDVGPGVFVPRPETELVVQAGIDALHAMDVGAQAIAVDLCAGSGAAGLSLAAETKARVWAVELSKDAYRYLERNRSALTAQVRERITTVQADARTALRHLDGTVDVIVTNPPYIPSDSRPNEPEVENFDPHIALYGLGADGLEVPRGVVVAAARLLRSGGFVAMEHGSLQGQQVRDMLEATGSFTDIATHRDLAGLDRFVTATRTDTPA